MEYQAIMHGEAVPTEGTERSTACEGGADIDNSSLSKMPPKIAA